MKVAYRHITLELEYFPKDSVEHLAEDILNKVHENRFGFKHYAVSRHTIESDPEKDE